MKLYMFRTVPVSIIRSFSVYTQQWYMSYRFADWVPSWYCSQAVSKTVWHIPLLCVQWKTPDDGQRNCPKHIDFHSKNNFEKSMNLVGFIKRNSHSYNIKYLLLFHGDNCYMNAPKYNVVRTSPVFSSLSRPDWLWGQPRFIDSR